MSDIVYDLDDPNIFIKNEQKMKYINGYLNELNATKVISQNSIMEFENHIQYNVITKYMPIKMFTVFPSETGLTDALRYLNMFMQEYRKGKVAYENDKFKLHNEIINKVDNVINLIEDIRRKQHQDELSIDEMFKSIILSNIRNKELFNSEDIPNEVQEYSDYIQSLGIKLDSDTDGHGSIVVSDMDIAMKAFKYEDITLDNIINKIPADFTFYDAYMYLKVIVKDGEMKSKIIRSIRSMIKRLISTNNYTFDQYRSVISALDASINFLHAIVVYNNDGSDGLQEFTEF